MNRFDHFVVAITAVVILSVYLPHYLVLSEKETLVLFSSIVFFSSMFTPDVDLKIPWLAHRGATHNPFWIVFIGFVMWGLSVIALKALGHADLSGYMLPLWAGQVAGWHLHLAADYAYDRIRQVTWLVLFVVLVGAFWFARG